ncbi:MAG: hypothetical protein MJZ77_02840 [Bacteroidales bacterium]|nr:hypothetical protein [Bacteroidales bacterium]
MKLIKLFLPMLAVMMLASGCTDEYYGSQIKTYQFNITPSEWIRSEGNNLPGANNYLYCTKNIPDIDQYVFEQGTVQAYAWNVYDPSTNTGAWNTLPFIYPLEILAQDDDGNLTMFVVPENLRFEWERGKVTFIIQDLDGYDPEDMVSTISIKVCISYNM